VLSASMDITSLRLVTYNNSSSIHVSAIFFDFAHSQVRILDNVRS
jgi:hypothetical protein